MPTKRIHHRRLRAVLAAFAAAVLSTHAVAQTHSFAWKATKGSGAVYLVGSVHMLTTDFYPLPPSLEAGFKDSDLLVEEADLAEMLSPNMQFSMLSRGMLPAGQTLDKVISPATLSLLDKHTSALGMPVEALKQFKPWMLAMTIEAMEWQKAGFDAELGLDKHFFDRAQSENKTIQGLETTDFQISLFDGMTMEQQDRFLAETLKGVATETASVGKLAAAWKVGDLASIERLVLADVKSDPLVYDRLLVARNRVWLPKIEALFSRPQHAFVVVGAAHLVGPDGLLAMLRAKGYRLVQL
ncbi:MAG TPA: TraB/GumN family protein [Vicinamibacterales bacterium]|nr:TraB/GumN family protein [Vicinamibacterales bacterium]